MATQLIHRQTDGQRYTWTKTFISFNVLKYFQGIRSVDKHSFNSQIIIKTQVALCGGHFKFVRAYIQSYVAIVLRKSKHCRLST